jgi:hypothetical protein
LCSGQEELSQHLADLALKADIRTIRVDECDSKGEELE